MHGRSLSALRICLVCAAVWSEWACAAVYYVDQNHKQANDDNAGTESSPWKTINHAAGVLSAGDTVIVKQATYNVGASANWAVPAVNPSRSGTKDSPITFRAYPGDQVIVTTSGGQAAIGSSGRDYIIWEGFEVHTADRAKGVLVMGAEGCTIAYCKVVGNHMATGDNHDGIRIERAPSCRIHHCIIQGVKGNGANSAGIKVYSKGARNVIVEDNYIRDNTVGVFDKDFGVENTYRRNYFAGNGVPFYGNNQGGTAIYYIYDNVFDGTIELHAGNAGTEIHDNLVRADRLVGAWAGGVADVKIWNNILLSGRASAMGCQFKKQPLSSVLAYMDYNLYDAPPTYDFGEYTSNRQRLTLAEMQERGFETHSHAISPADETSGDGEPYAPYGPAGRWSKAGRYEDGIGPHDIALVLDVSRYGPPAERKPARAE